MMSFIAARILLWSALFWRHHPPSAQSTRYCFGTPAAGLWGELPSLVVTNSNETPSAVQLGGPVAISTYLAGRLGLGAPPSSGTAGEAVAVAVTELATAISGRLSAVVEGSGAVAELLGSPPAKVAAAIEGAAVPGTLAFRLRALDRRLYGKLYLFGGDAPTAADYHIFAAVDQLLGVLGQGELPGELCEGILFRGCSELRRFHENFSRRPGVVAACAAKQWSPWLTQLAGAEELRRYPGVARACLDHFERSTGTSSAGTGLHSKL